MKKSFKSLEACFKTLKFVFKLEIMPKNELVKITCTDLSSQLRELAGGGSRPCYPSNWDGQEIQRPSSKLFKKSSFKNFLYKNLQKE